MMSKPDAPVRVAGQIEAIDLWAGVLCLDFVNTVEPRIQYEEGEPTIEYLTGYANLIAWSERAGALTTEETARLRAAAEKQPSEAEAALERAIALRETLYGIFHAVAHAEKPDAEALALLSRVYADAMQQLQLEVQGDGFALAWKAQPDLQRPLWAVARSAVDLLLSGERRRIKECPGSDGCGWLFYDESKNNSRVWCSMQDCGMRAKDRRRGKRTRRAE